MLPCMLLVSQQRTHWIRQKPRVLLEWKCIKLEGTRQNTTAELSTQCQHGHKKVGEDYHLNTLK